MVWRSSLLFVGLGLVVGPAWADTVEISGGGHVYGKVEQEVNNTKMPYVVIALDDDIKIAVQQSRVRRTITADEFAEYERRRQIADQDPELHYKLAIWCEENKLSPQSRFHMQRTIALDPDHSKARASLGYVPDENDWILFSEQQRNRGLISVAGRWVLPEAVAQDRMQDETEKQVKLWIKKVVTLRSTATNVRRNGARAAEALEEINGIVDPLAALAVANELKDSRGNKTQSRDLRRIWVKLLGRFRNTTAVAALVLAGIDEPDNEIREAAMDQLQNYGSASAVATYLPRLNPKKYKNSDIKKALRALSFFPDRALAMNYVDALVTTHMIEQAPGPGLSVGRSNTGGGGLAMGGKKKPVPQTIRNPGALTLLKMVEPDVDFGFDQQAWREYFAAQLTAYEGDLRRDP